jgi:hypothetical protein
MTITVTKSEVILREKLGQIERPVFNYGGQLSTAYNINDVQAVHNNSMFRNRIHNGNFNVWQRGTTSTYAVSAITNNVYWADRWVVYQYNSSGWANAANFTIKQTADHPLHGAGGNCCEITVNTAASSPPSSSNTDFFSLTHNIEGYNCYDLMGFDSKPTTLSFWVKTNKVGVYAVEIRPSGPNSSTIIILPYTVNISGVWTRVTLSIPPYTESTLPADNNTRLQIQFMLATSLKPGQSGGSGISQAQLKAVTNQWGTNPWGNGVGVMVLKMPKGNAICLEMLRKIHNHVLNGFKGSYWEVTMELFWHVIKKYNILDQSYIFGDEYVDCGGDANSIFKNPAKKEYQIIHWSNASHITEKNNPIEGSEYYRLCKQCGLI